MISRICGGRTRKGHFALARPRELSVRAWATYASRSRSVHFPTTAYGFGSREAARLVRCRVRTGAPDGRAPGKMRSGVQPTSGGQPRSPSEVVERDWWAARILGVRSRRRRQLGGRAARRERGGRPPNLAWTSASMSGGSVTIMVRFGPRPSALGARARFFWDGGALAGFIFEF